MSILDPISPENRCGTDFKYDDQYLNIEIEIEKAFNAISEEEIKWDFIIGKSEEILSKNSKDLKLASYWLYSQWRKNGWSNFFNHFDTFTMFVAGFEKNLYPLKSTRKIKIFEWLESVFEKPFLDILDQLSEAELERLKEILDKLNDSVPACVEADLSIFREVHKRTIEFIVSAKKREEERAKERQLQEEEDKKRQLEATLDKEAKDMRRSEEREILDKLSSGSIKNINFENMEELSYEMLEMIIDPTIEEVRKFIDASPVDYFSIKPLFSLGETLLEKAFSDTNMLTDDFVPSVDVCNASREILENGSTGLEQLSALEEQLLIRPTWLEGYYILSQLLYKLNKPHDAKRLEELILHFVHRRKELLDFMIDERALIEEGMQLWLNEKLLTFGDSDDASVKYKMAYQEALIIKDEKGTEEALAFLEKNYKSSLAEEEHFRWRLVFSEFALAIGNKKLALSLLLELEKIINEYSLDKWQPELAIETYEILLKPILMQELGSENKERIYQKLSILDMQKIINLQP